MSQEIDDLGIGTKFSKRTKRIINSDGTYNINRLGTRKGIKDVFRYLTTVSWLKFFLILFLGYIALNVIFTLLYVLCGTEHISGIDPENGHPIIQTFFFSIQTFTTVGYGGMAPMGIATQSVAAVEAFVGFLSFSLATGLLYGRFSRPTSKLMFSDNLLYTKYRDGHGLMLKIANERNSVLLEVEAMLIATFDQMTEDGEIKKRYYRLPLELNRIEMMTFSWTLVHGIDKESPFYGMTEEDFMKAKPEFLVMIKGFSEVFGQYIHSRKSYTEDDMLWNKKFQAIFGPNEEGVMEMDVRNINLTTDE